MKHIHNKLLALALTISILFTCCIPAFATNSNCVVNEDVIQHYSTANYDYFEFEIETTDHRSWSANASIGNGEIVVYLRQGLADEIYERVFNMEEYSLSRLSMQAIAEDAVLKALDSIDLAVVYHASDNVIEITEENISDFPELRDATENELYAAIQAIHGSPFDTIGARFTNYPGVNSIEIHWNLMYHVNRYMYFSFNNGETLGYISQVLKRFGAVDLAKLANALGLVDHVVTAIYGYRYDVIADWCKYSTVNNGSYQYTACFKYTYYLGIKELSGNRTAKLVDDGYTQYVPSMNYYYLYSAQADDAYAAYMEG